MNLGEMIYRLRTEKQMSQGELAEMLEVSRQSISKWENNSAVPELDKLIRLSEIFEVSLDELVKGEEKTKDIPPEVRTEVVYEKASGFYWRPADGPFRGRKGPVRRGHPVPARGRGPYGIGGGTAAASGAGTEE